MGTHNYSRYIRSDACTSIWGYLNAARAESSTALLHHLPPPGWLCMTRVAAALALDSLQAAAACNDEQWSCCCCCWPLDQTAATARTEQHITAHPVAVQSKSQLVLPASFESGALLLLMCGCTCRTRGLNHPTHILLGSS